MEIYAKLISDEKIHYAPKNRGNILNYNHNFEVLKQDGYKLLVKTEIPKGQRRFIITYSEDEENIYENIKYLETEEECERRLLVEEVNQEIEKINIKINDLDLKRIRAVCEPSIKDEKTGETWLEYYNSQIVLYRNQINNLKERLSNDDYIE